MPHAKTIAWTCRYSSTDEPDERGRWARVGYIGSDEALGFSEGKPTRFQVAWIEKGISYAYVVHYYFPCNGSFAFDTLDEAKQAVQDGLEWFLKHVTTL